MKTWLDDFNLQAPTKAALLNVQEKFLWICSERSLYLSAVKSKFYAKQIKWCGRVVDASGCRLNPARLSALRHMEPPTAVSELAEFIYFSRWMSTSMPDFAGRVSPLTSILEEAYSRSGKRTKRSIKNISLHTLP